MSQLFPENFLDLVWLSEINPTPGEDNNLVAFYRYQDEFYKVEGIFVEWVFNNIFQLGLRKILQINAPSILTDKNKLEMLRGLMIELFDREVIWPLKSS